MARVHFDQGLGSDVGGNVDELVGFVLRLEPQVNQGSAAVRCSGHEKAAGGVPRGGNEGCTVQRGDPLFGLDLPGFDVGDGQRTPGHEAESFRLILVDAESKGATKSRSLGGLQPGRGRGPKERPGLSKDEEKDEEDADHDAQAAHRDDAPRDAVPRLDPGNPRRSGLHPLSYGIGLGVAHVPGDADRFGASVPNGSSRAPASRCRREGAGIHP